MKTIIVTGTSSGLGQSLFDQITLKPDLTRVDEQSSEVAKCIIDEYIGV